MKICIICGKPAECKHHLIFGNSRRRLCDEDGITLYMCNEHHNMAAMAVDRIHNNSMAEALSKMLGQAMWERNYVAEGLDLPFPHTLEDARRAFIGRYGRNYL